MCLAFNRESFLVQTNSVCTSAKKASCSALGADAARDARVCVVAARDKASGARAVYF